MNPVFNEKYVKTIPLGQYINGKDTGIKYSASSQILRGTVTFSKDKLREIDPSYTGYTHIFVLKMPYYLEQLANGKQVANDIDTITKAKYHYDNLKALFELGSTSYSGTPSLTLNTTTLNTGYEERNIPVPTLAQYASTQFTIRCLETRSEPLRMGREFVISGITNPTAKFTDYYGATDDFGYPLEVVLENHTMSLMVVQTDPSLRMIQDISLWNSAFFTDVDRSQLDWELGTVDIVQAQDVQFNGIYIPNMRFNENMFAQAKTLLMQRYAFYKKVDELTEYDLGLTPTNATA